MSHEVLKSIEVGPISQHELEELEAMMSITVELYGGSRTETVLDRFLFDMHVHARSDDPFIYNISAKNVLADETTRFVLDHYYPDASEDDLDKILRLDIGAYARIGSWTFIDTNRQTEYDNKQYKQELQDFVFGTETEVQMYPYARKSAFDFDSDLSLPVRNRLLDGMPRQLQLLLAVRLIGNESDSPENLRYDGGTVVPNIIKAFNLSDDELKLVVKLVQQRGDVRSVSLAHNIIASNNEELLNRVRTEDGSIDLELLGGNTVIRELLQRTFYGYGDAHWDYIVELLGGDLVESLYSFEERRELVLEKLRDRPHIPDGNKAEYVSTEEIAQAAYDKIIERLESELPEYGWYSKRLNYSKAHAAIEFEVDDVPFRLEELDKYKKLITTLEATAPEASELAIAGQVWRNRISEIDPYLDAWFEEYAREKHNGDLDPLPADGWTGDPEEEFIIQQHIESRERSLQKMKKIEEEVREYLAKQ